MVPTERGLRLGPLHLPVDEEAESIHVKFLQNPPGRKTFFECVRRFNANVPYSGLLYSVTQDVSFLYTILLCHINFFFNREYFRKIKRN